MLNKVPEVTVYFWIIKILCTTVGESFADYINETLGFGLTNTTLLFSAALVVALVAQFRLNRYVPGVYWLAVVLISVVGTLLTDNLTDGRGVPLWISSTVFAVLLAAVFGDLVRPRAHPVDPHHRHHPARGVLLADRARHLRPRYGGRRLDPRADRLVPRRVGAPPAGPDPGRPRRLEARRRSGALFWLAYILTRPLGANIGDYLGLTAAPTAASASAPSAPACCSSARSSRSWST